MTYVMVFLHITISLTLLVSSFFIWKIYKRVDTIKLLEKTNVIFKDRPKPKAGGVIKNKVSVNTEQSIWEREQNGHARSTDQIV